MADEAKFVTFGKQTVNVNFIVRGEWAIAQSGRSVNVHVYLNDGHQLCCPYDDPNCKKFADLLGFTTHYADWPKQKAAADAAYHKAEADKKAAALASRRGAFAGAR